MLTSLFDYDLPPHLIAQQPAEPRDSSRLLVLDRTTGQITHRTFRDITDYLRPGDLLVGNDSRVIPARLHGRKVTGGAVEVFLLRQLDESGCQWECLLRGKRLKVGTRLEIGRLGDWVRGTPGQSPNLPISQSPNTHHAPRTTQLSATILALNDSGTRIVEFAEPIRSYLDELGETPLPPYITQFQGDKERYQTVYSRPEGSAAAPTAGLHFTSELLVRLRAQGVRFDTVTLHVGLDTFKPVDAERVEDHRIHSEWAEVSAATARQINESTLAGGRVVTVGTTSTRTLEWAATGAQGLDPYDLQACPWQRVAAFAGNVTLFIHPGYRFRAVDALITNFHLPRSSLLMLVSAFIGQAHPDDLDAGRRMLLESYEVAKREGYRFFSFGDAMLIV